MLAKKLSSSGGTASSSGSGDNIEDLFKTKWWDGTGSNQTITTGVDLQNDGGMIWSNSYSSNNNGVLVDTERGHTKVLYTKNVNTEDTNSSGQDISGFTSSGFTVGTPNRGINTNNENYLSLIFKKQAKFFDIVTYTGNGTNRTVAHNLGQVPGMMWIKSTTGSGTYWKVWHRALKTNSGNNPAWHSVMGLNHIEGGPYETGTAVGDKFFNSLDPTSSVINLGDDSGINGTGNTYVVYLFGHQEPDDDHPLIACGGYTGNSATLDDVYWNSETLNHINLGFEPQFLMVKRWDSTSSSAWSSNPGGHWQILTQSSGFSSLRQGSYQYAISMFLNAAGDTNSSWAGPSPTGFWLQDAHEVRNYSGHKYIYMAIRRGPMAEATAGSQIFAADVSFDSTRPGYDSPGMNPDMVILQNTAWPYLLTRSGTRYETSLGLYTPTADTGSIWRYDNGFGVESGYSGEDAYMFARRKNAFDIIQWVGTGSAQNITHNLGAVPGMMWVKNLDEGYSWSMYYGDNGKMLQMNDSSGPNTSTTYWNDTSPTDAVITVGSSANTNSNKRFFMGILFGSLDGITKVGTVNVTGAVDVDCGFSNGVSLVIMKEIAGGRTLLFCSTGDGISGIRANQNDTFRYIHMQSGAVTNTDVIDPYSSGFSLTSNFLSIPDNSSGNYIYYAVAT